MAVNYQIRAEGYGALTIEALSSVGGSPTPISILQPPMPQPVLDTSSETKAQSGKQQAQPVPGTQAGGTGRFSRPWLSWFQSLYQTLSAGNSDGVLSVLAPSVDETDIGWYGTGSAIGTDDPVTLAITLVGVTRFGPQLDITNPGSGYGSAPTITISSQNGQGQPAKGTGIITGGKLTGWTQTTQGYNLAAPLVVTISGGGGAAATATLGRQFAVGDFIVWNDTTQVSNAYSYEIDQITAITPTDDTHFGCTLQRAADGAASGDAQYGSGLVAHAAGTALYRLINKEWQITLDLSSGVQVLKFLWDSMTVAAVTLSGGGLSTPLLTNMAPTPFLPDGSSANVRATPPAPGLRTMNGAAYCSLGVLGTLAVGVTSTVRIPVQAWESLRTIYAKLRGAPAGPTTFNGDTNACVVIYVCYISPAGLVGLIDTLVIDASQLNSYSSTNAPDGRDMPFHAFWPPVAPNFDWPPNVLPQLTGALNGSGNLQLGFTVSTTDTVVFAPDGVIDFIVAQVGTTTAGASLTVAVQT